MVTEKKQCCSCGVAKPLDDFYARSASPDGLQPRCKECDHAARRASRNADPDSFYGHRRARQYGITPFVYDMIVKGQRKRCAICRMQFDDDHRPVIDHDHATGYIRGILCSSCNSGIGFLRDSVKVVEAAVQYLRMSDDGDGDDDILDEEEDVV